MTSSLKLSVIIPTYNRRKVLERTLPTVFAQDFPGDQYEVIVVVDGARDGTAEMLRGFKPACTLRVIEQPLNRGQAEAKNIGIQAAQGEFILFLDDDVICDPSLLAKHLEEHSAAENLIVFGPVLVHHDSPPTLATDSIRVWTDNYLKDLERAREPQFPHQLWICSNCSVPRMLLLRCGGFDTTLRKTHDDADLAIRLWKMGSRFRYQPEAIAYYLYVKSPQVVVGTDAGWYGRNDLVLCRKHPEYRPYSAFLGIGSGNWSKRFLSSSAKVTL
jgi:GT2 family glycosyltransferase